MLHSLKVSNYAIIDELEINFLKGFNIITGETGAGKSILIGALGLIMGNRADTKVLFDLEKKCIVEASFDITDYELREFFLTNELEYDDQLILRREILPNSKSRAFINDTPANLKTIKDLAVMLIDMHQQFDTLGLNNPEVQLNLLDAYAGNEANVFTYKETFEQLQSKKIMLNRLIKKKEQAEKDQELLKYQLEEFEKLDLKEGQLKDWEDELSLLENAETIKNALTKAAYAIDQSEPSIMANLQDLNYDISKISSLHPEINTLHERFLNILEELRDIASDFEQRADMTDLDPERLIETQSKVNLAYQLLTKHHLNTEEDLLKKWEDISNQINNFKQSGAEITKTKSEIAALEKACFEIATTISSQRKNTSVPLCKQVEENLHRLSMENAQFQIFVNATKELGESGIDEVGFLFTANKGARLQEIKEVASGGELSRLSLCIKTELAKSVKLPTLIFDEIDSGVSGAVSMKMGNMIKQLSDTHQIINITHSPQIASKADRHYRIFKETSENRSFTKMEILDDNEKTLEIAKMLSGDPPSEAAIENAKELMRMA